MATFAWEECIEEERKLANGHRDAAEQTSCWRLRTAPACCLPSAVVSRSALFRTSS
jgi:hypothetical protein